MSPKKKCQKGKLVENARHGHMLQEINVVTMSTEYSQCMVLKSLHCCLYHVHHVLCGGFIIFGGSVQSQGMRG